MYFAHRTVYHCPALNWVEWNWIALFCTTLHCTLHYTTHSSLYFTEVCYTKLFCIPHTEYARQLNYSATAFLRLTHPSHLNNRKFLHISNPFTWENKLHPHKENLCGIYIFFYCLNFVYLSGKLYFLMCKYIFFVNLNHVNDIV